MKRNFLELSKGDYIRAYRPLYNASEVIFDGKKIRPYVVLDVYEDDVLVVSVTSNGYNHHNLEVGPWSYARVNDLYIIPKRDIQVILNSHKLSEQIYEKLLQAIYNCAINNDIIYSNELKEMFLDMMTKREKERKYQELKEHSEIFNEGDVISQTKLPNQKYVIDKVVDDGYLAYRINGTNDNYNINFASVIKIVKDELYSLCFKVNLKLYKEQKEKFIIKKYQRSYLPCYNEESVDETFDTGDIIIYKKCEYLVIGKFENGTKVVVVPYNHNYILSEVIRIPTKYCSKSDIVLSNEELLVILKKVLNNIDVSQNENYQNLISVKMKKL